ncbi:MAG: CDP-alcohol phosphatidyltransferase family protein [Gemmatimonadota bacterium]|jgi:CDP-diacylglycerol--glycerol-3-phosphate 3-phosphatidyltransferase|nr:CDP-alcohol phosphatidyltransferase family protein [Gemmatimonadota bacterium]
MAAVNLPKHVQDRAVQLLAFLYQPLVDRNVNPNYVTTVGFLVTLSSAVAFFMGHTRVGGLLVLLGGLMDIIDGQVARRTGMASVFGSFYDSTLDRISEVAVFIGIFSLYSGGHPDFGYPWMVYTVALALAGSLMISYTRAKAEALGLNCSIGMMQRTERVVLIGGAALIFGGAFQGAVLTVVLIVMAVLTNFTAFQRIVWVYRNTAAPVSEPVMVDRKRVKVTSDTRKNS